MPESIESSSPSKSQRDLSILAGALASLIALVVFLPPGPSTFVHSVEIGNPISISLLASAIGLTFMLLYRAGFSLGYVEEIELERQESVDARRDCICDQNWRQGVTSP